jgi:hypothetical protein
MTHAEEFAINEWLSDYPEGKTYEDIIDMMVGSADENDEWIHDEISVWQTVEHFTLRQVAQFIEDTKKHFESTINRMKQEGALA